jgi:hypothetical protein
LSYHHCTGIACISAAAWVEFGQALGSGALKNLKELELRGHDKFGLGLRRSLGLSLHDSAAFCDVTLLFNSLCCLSDQ